MGGGRLLLAPPAQLGQLALEGGEANGDEGGQPLGAGHGQVELGPAGLGRLALAGVAGEALVELGQAPGEVGAALVEAGGPDLEPGAQGPHCRHPLLEALAGRAQGGEALGARRFLRLEPGQDRLELGHARRFAADALGQLVEVGPHGIGLDGDVASLALETVQGVGGGGQAAVVLVE